jgi:hypothetical protein
MCRAHEEKEIRSKRKEVVAGGRIGRTEGFIGFPGEE